MQDEFWEEIALRWKGKAEEYEHALIESRVVIGILVDRLGGRVEILDREFVEFEYWWRLMVDRPPDLLGTVVISVEKTGRLEKGGTGASG